MAIEICSSLNLSQNPCTHIATLLVYYSFIIIIYYNIRSSVADEIRFYSVLIRQIYSLYQETIKVVELVCFLRYLTWGTPDKDPNYHTMQLSHSLKNLKFFSPGHILTNCLMSSTGLNLSTLKVYFFEHWLPDRLTALQSVSLTQDCRQASSSDDVVLPIVCIISHGPKSCTKMTISYSNNNK